MSPRSTSATCRGSAMPAATTKTMSWRRSWSWNARYTPTTSRRASRRRSRRSTPTARCRRASSSFRFTTALRWSTVTTHTVLHNLIFGCLLVFLIQWIFLGDLRSAIIVGVNIPFALFFSIIILVLRGEDANLLSVGAVDFGIIVDSAVILVENIFRNFRPSAGTANAAASISPKDDSAPIRPRRPTSTDWTDRLRMIFVSALQVDKAVFFSTAITVAAFVPLVHHAGGRRPDLQSHGAHLRLRAVRGAARDVHGDAGPRLLLLPEHVEEVETLRRARAAVEPIRRSCAGR